MDASSKKKISRTIDFYNGFSEKYDRKYAAYLKHTHRHLLDHVGDLSGKKVLDVSCGTGILAKHLFEMFAEIQLHLNDPSDGMRSVAMARFENHPDIEFSNDLAENLQVEPDSYDSVICLNSFHYYADQQAAIENMRGALKPGGSLYLLDWNLEGWFHLPNKIVSLLSPENINTRSLPETEGLLKNSGIKPVSSERWSYRFWKFYFVEANK